jgi:hypothetical protein
MTTTSKKSVCVSSMVTFLLEHTVVTITYSLILGVGWAQHYSAGLRAGWSGFRVSAGAPYFSLLHHVQTGSGAHPASYPMDTRGSFPGDKTAKAWIWPTHLHLVPRSRTFGAMPPLPNTSSRRGVQLKHRDNFIFTFTFTRKCCTHTD